MGWKNSTVDKELAELGASSSITRRDFLGGLAVGGAGLLGGLSPRELLAAEKSGPDVSVPPIDKHQAARFNGPGGVGDYRNSNGNTWEVLSRAHLIRDGHYGDLSSTAYLDGGDDYDVIMIGGGPSTIGASYRLIKEKGDSLKGLILENHQVLGGKARQNEFEVDGHTIFGPQGANLVILPTEPGQVALGEDLLYEEFTDIGMPLHFDPVALTGTDKPLEADVSNYMYMWLGPVSDSIGYFGKATKANPEPKLVKNPWINGFGGLGFSAEVEQDLMKWQWGLTLDRPAEGLDQWLDSMSYEQLLVDVHGLSPEVARFADPMLATGIGLGSSTCSALAATYNMEMPGARLVGDPHTAIMNDPKNRGLVDTWKGFNVHCFPGGNSFPYRYFLKYIWPDCLKGAKTPRDVLDGDIRFDQLDTDKHPIRIRLGATVVDVRHVPGSAQKKVRVVYEKGGQLYAAYTKSVILGSASWVNRNILGDAPADIRSAMDSFEYGPVVVANVALTNWRFMEKLGVTSVMYQGGEFGFMCNIRQPLDVGGYRPPFDPDKPIVMTFYAPLIEPSLSAKQQGSSKRWELFSTPYRDIELKIRRQMVAMFGRTGFDPSRDIAGITLNRWGHAFAVPGPGFFHPAGGGTSNSDTLRQGYDRIFFANGELRGLQGTLGAHSEGQRAARQVLEII
ncbi:twin-arginine translocation signal domain-containing protein [Pseudomaricurvus alkylphenolicus]|uniref:twin-arginine translocation signal domain-containing protein n=1 Tax=Pseudomaricurvus alkylphenolicus TaxID=1306991 RepID=UPI0014234C16|nr:twin-arginine translocation signal domain-containing protein [Pseudomaricurvus alkylphenolicus]NIB44891.1 twin-arginine translocation signal domain-containing protein [Pseudomaricurvus alkylphenolicus]